MNRSSFRNVWLFSLIGMILATILIYRQGLIVKDSIASNQVQLNSLQRELDNVARRAQSLDQLDQLTMDERNATRLDILRHLGIEKTDYKMDVNVRQERPIGDAILYLRNITLSVDMPYAQALLFADTLYAQQKMNLTRLALNPSAEFGDFVRMEVVGTIFGLDKVSP